MELGMMAPASSACSGQLCGVCETGPSVPGEMSSEVPTAVTARQSTFCGLPPFTVFLPLSRQHVLGSRPK